ncbi:Fe-S-containing hydro-lyase [Treponema pedis]|uniref:Fumarate hydratase n=4 Tax=Treponema pedis TaxID=409322 RepID=S5ZPG6_9SPIR|nr:Fe-S-containing hydro-lyase [Treponema pedis]AGT44517.1 fumarate hydratase [Treponema pedis str. T A4]QOW59834.1 Fe-S-containing hydro-lyase [Treponema pedis]
MSEQKKLKTPLKREDLKDIKAGDIVLLSGYIYTGRDAAHKRLCELLEKGERLPIDVRGAVMYYVGPTPAKPGEPIGSAGPTTSYRMDAYTPQLLDEGLAAMIGKGKRNDAVVEKIMEHGACYFAAIGGAAALIKSKIKSAELICYEDLGAEAIRRLYVEDFPVTCIIDSKGNNLYKLGREEYLKSL